jgi:hypothetical protein
MLEDGGSVDISSVVEAAAPLARLTCEFGLKEQVAPAIMYKLQEKTTVLEMLLNGVTESVDVPVSPEVIVSDGALDVISKSGIFTWTETPPSAAP